MKTLGGEITVVDVTRFCPKHHDQVYHPDNLLTPHRSHYGFDVIAEVGRLRYTEHKQVTEIQSCLMQKGLKVPERTVQWLCDRYLEFVTAVHLESSGLIRKMLEAQGGYVLHIDGTGTKGQMVLLFRDGWSGINLFSITVPSEGQEFVVPHLEYLKKRFGKPVTVLRDRSKGLKAAVLEVFPDTYVVICHFHFLKDIGLILFDRIYPSFRNRIQRRGIKKKLSVIKRILRRRGTLDEEERLALYLVGFILDYHKDAHGLPYPFSLSAVDFFRRCEAAGGRVRKGILERAKKNKSSPMLSRLEDVLRLLKPPPMVLGRIQADFDEMQTRWDWFQRVRRALRYRNGPIPLSTRQTLSEKNLNKGRLRLNWLLGKLSDFDENGGYGPHERQLRKDLRKVANAIEENMDSLFAPNIIVPVGKKHVVRLVPRTNAPVEGEYRTLRRHGRRIRGNNDVESQVQRDGPGMLMVENLTNKKYLSTIYGSPALMPERFSKVTKESLALAKTITWGSRELSRGNNPQLLQ